MNISSKCFHFCRVVLSTHSCFYVSFDVKNIIQEYKILKVPWIVIDNILSFYRLVIFLKLKLSVILPLWPSSEITYTFLGNFRRKLRFLRNNDPADSPWKYYQHLTLVNARFNILELIFHDYSIYLIISQYCIISSSAINQSINLFYLNGQS